MASYRVLAWRGIPSQVKVTDGSGVVVDRQLPPFFQQEIDRVAMAEGLADSDDYLELWAWSPARDHAGDAAAVADEIVRMVEAEWRRSGGSS